ncbi:cytochrome P450 [Nocardia sp. CA-128927]|uniref:cytochrome P450 n=1 Tax=Nocardia sp. CA-128927 TaxID=3239975 RepID=UPI003D989E9C
MDDISGVSPAQNDNLEPGFESRSDSGRPEKRTNSITFNPFAPGFANNPYPHYTELRDQSPVSFNPLGFWVLTKYHDVSALLRSNLSVESKHLAPSPIRELRDRAGGDRGWRMFGLAMADRDPPDHTRLRKLVSKVFTPRAIAELESNVIRHVDNALDRIAHKRRCDLVDELASPLPFAVIGEMLGMPNASHARIREVTGTFVRSLEPVNDPTLLAAIAEADTELIAIVTDSIAWKRKHLTDDLLSALICAEVDGDVLSSNELIAQVALLYVAGHQTTVNLIANGTLALLEAPDQLRSLRTDPSIAANTVEEVLRFDSPVQMSRRITITPYTVGEHEIPAGSIVLASIGSANRDESFWGPHAAELHIGRPDARSHLSFGAGAHACLGPALARLEGRIAVERLVSRFDSLRIDGDVERNGRINLRGLDKLPVRI